MGRIVFLNSFGKNEMTGGIKTAYRHVELLQGLGFDASVYQPEGAPSWFESRAKVLTAQPFKALPGDILVFPEVLVGPFRELAQMRTPAEKVLYCQNQYYMTLNGAVAEGYAEMGFRRFAASSARAKAFMESVFHVKDVAIIPCFIDRDLFAPQTRKSGIALVPRKMPREAAVIRNIFQAKYPHLRHVTWNAVDNRSERETAAVLGGSLVCLSLGFLESLGLIALEAMAAGTIVVGFHGYGGLEYATDENGLWFPPDHLEETADALAQAILGIEKGDARFAVMREAGFATAARYSKDATLAALREFFRPRS
ncbi:MAG TPA: glycosyltransferase [Micropepsaceae bacterium]|nr:glycosyltransferase [Micropepsaceae bacterium]